MTYSVTKENSTDVYLFKMFIAKYMKWCRQKIGNLLKMVCTESNCCWRTHSVCRKAESLEFALHQCNLHPDIYQLTATLKICFPEKNIVPVKKTTEYTSVLDEIRNIEDSCNNRPLAAKFRTLYVCVARFSCIHKYSCSRRLAQVPKTGTAKL